jgi:hypothetical protein
LEGEGGRGSELNVEGEEEKEGRKKRWRCERERERKNGCVGGKGRRGKRGGGREEEEGKEVLWVCFEKGSGLFFREELNPKCRRRPFDAPRTLPPGEPREDHQKGASR